jgi:UDP-N-acetyl-D-glucosamine dehydrogenase
VDLANDINDHMPEYVVRRVIEGLNRLGRPVLESRVLLLGLAYKKNSSDARESPARQVARQLASLGARVSAADNYVQADALNGEVARVSVTADVVREADAVVILTDHDGVDYGLVEREARWVLDCRNRLAGDKVESL